MKLKLTIAPSHFALLQFSTTNPAFELFNSLLKVIKGVYDLKGMGGRVLL